jgi:AraC-like DNA-binding protein
MQAIIEHIPRRYDRSFACLSYNGPSFESPYHSHPEIEILLIDKSHGRFLVGTSSGFYRPGDIFLLGSNLPHLFQNVPHGGPGRGTASSRFMQFLPDCMGEGLIELPEMMSVRRLLTNASRGLHFPAGSNGKLLRLFRQTFSAQGVSRITGLLDLLAAMTEDECKPLCRTGHQYLAGKTHRLGSAVEAIQRTFRESPRLGELAKLTSMNPSSFSRSFRKAFGIPLQNYLTILRLEECCRMMVETDANISEIAFAAGFRNLANFNRHFKRNLGRCPRQYRTEITALFQPAA